MAYRNNGHLDEATIKYGEGVLTLRKSNKLIGVKSQPGIRGDILSAVAPGLGKSDSQTQTLGGFRLINVEDAPATLEETLDTLRANEVVSKGTHVYYTSDDEVPFVPTGQIYVECSEDTTPEQCQQLIQEHGLQILEARGEHVLIVKVTERSSNPVKTADALQKSPMIKKAEPDLATPGKLRAFAVPVDLRLTEQWHLRNTGFHRSTVVGFRSGADARVVAAWEAAGSLGSPSVIVAVIDDGFDLSHPDLSGSGKIVAPKDFTRNSANPIPDVDAADWHGSACLYACSMGAGSLRGSNRKMV
jgi:subtilisin family serine protease